MQEQEHMLGMEREGGGKGEDGAAGFRVKSRWLSGRSMALAWLNNESGACHEFEGCGALREINGGCIFPMHIIVVFTRPGSPSRY